MNDTTRTNSRGFPVERPLTEGEKQLARQVFGDGIEYDKVKIYGKKYPLALGMQPNDRAMAPNGNIYFSPEDPSQSADFSAATATWEQRRLFIHEMTHVWQNHSGRAVKLEGFGVQTWNQVSRAFGGNPRTGYDYDFDPQKKLRTYNLEQQGEIVTDYYGAKFENRPLPNRRTVAEYEQVLSEFLRDPLYEKKEIEQKLREREEQESRASTQELNPATRVSSNYNSTVREQMLFAFGPELNGVKTDAFRTVVTQEQLLAIRKEVPLGVKGVDIVTYDPDGKARYQTVYHVGQLSLKGPELNLALRELDNHFAAMINAQAAAKGMPAPFPESALAPVDLALKGRSNEKWEEREV